jgi:hypothetical protein
MLFFITNKVKDEGIAIVKLSLKKKKAIVQLELKDNTDCIYAGTLKQHSLLPFLFAET